MFRMRAACGCNQGRIRSRNEDNFYFNGRILSQNNWGLDEILCLERKLDNPICFGVFDGMGGESHGGEAPYISAQTLQEYVDRGMLLPTNLMQMCLDANSRLCELAIQHQTETVGSTVAILNFDTEWANCINVGDSKIFLLRGKELCQLSTDHTDEAIMKKYGQRRSPRLTQYLGIPPAEMVIEPYTASTKLRHGDIFLVCSDGLSDIVPSPEIQELLSYSSSAQCAVENLVRAALSAGGRDNITVIVCVVE